ncbi:Transcriptional regulator, XRE family protein [Nitratireductor aquimarinus]|uniref:MbcA/ParS/Xre antitoxin family protein n=1 Tax=Nitratireductor aquimarinus TaxID=889300 RepID=UPI003B58C4BC
MPQLQKISAPEKTAVAAKAAVKAAELLQVSGRELSRILGVSEATMSRIRRAPDAGILHGKPYELALLFVRLYRSLDAITGGDDQASSAWLHAHNELLGGVPAERILRIDGLVHVLAYLDTRRAPL